MEFTRTFFVGRSLIINVLGASLFWYLAKIFIVPNWVIAAFDRLVWPFLWKGKTETIRRNILINNLQNGGLKVVNFSAKCKALLVSNLTSFLDFSRNSKWHWFARYYLGRRLSFLNERWRPLSANNVPSALTLPEFYQASFDALKEFLSSGAQPATAKKCYEFFVAKTAEQPARIRSHWRPHVGCAFNWPNLWKLVRHPSGENVKNDLLWLIIMRGVKVRSILKKWNYINYDHCSFCRRSETLEHCFFECGRLGTVWRHFQPLLDSLQPTKLAFHDLILYSGSSTDPACIMSSFIIKTVLYEIWNSRNRATFSNKQDTAQIIIQNANNEIAFRLKQEFKRSRVSPFKKLWAVKNCLCKVVDDHLTINV